MALEHWDVLMLGKKNERHHKNEHFELHTLCMFIFSSS